MAKTKDKELKKVKALYKSLFDHKIRALKYHLDSKETRAAIYADIMASIRYRKWNLKMRVFNDQLHKDVSLVLRPKWLASNESEVDTTMYILANTNGIEVLVNRERRIIRFQSTGALLDFIKGFYDFEE